MQIFSELLFRSYHEGEAILSRRSLGDRKKKGQFLTPIEIARLMADNLGEIKSGDRILDPAIGSGVLVFAVLEKIISSDLKGNISVVGFEIDKELFEKACQLLEVARAEAALHGIDLHFDVKLDDFLLHAFPSSSKATTLKLVVNICHH